MKRIVLLDSSSWVDFFDKNPRSAKIPGLMDGAHVLYSIISVHEVARKAYARGQPARVREVIGTLEEAGSRVDLTPDIAIEAARLRTRYAGLSMADALILASAKAAGATLVTSDHDFKNRKVTDVPVITL